MTMLPGEIQAEASVRVVGKPGLFDVPELPTPRTVRDFCSDDRTRADAVQCLTRLGFRVLHAGPVSITISGSPAIFERELGTQHAVVERESRVLLTALGTRDPTFVATEGFQLGHVLAGIALYSDPVELSRAQRPSPAPPTVPYWHLAAPGDIVEALAAADVHAAGVTGVGVKIAVVDTGCYSHPYFDRFSRPPHVVLGPGASAPEVDEVGHGTMVTANVMTLAPGADVTVFKLASSDRLAPAAFKMAVDAGPAVIENTWGYGKKGGLLTAFDRVVAAMIAYALSAGIVVVFAGGNGKTLYPSQLPELIAVGGVFRRPDGVLEAASYASGYESTLFPGRIVPDFCGSVGMKPEGVYLMLPTQPGSVIDATFAASPYPAGDDTGAEDGWVCISGTSASSGQVAGVAALLRQLRPQLTNGDVKALLARTARHVTIGESSEGNPAGPGKPNLATGWGMVDAAAAAAAARDMPRG